MFKIGEFSRLTQVSVKTLRYYDTLGLLRPAKVDPFTDYRYYSAEQLPRLNRILILKELGFSLDEIGRLLDERVSAAELRGMLRLKQAEAQRRVEEEQARLRRIQARLLEIEQEAVMSEYEVVVKSIPAQKVASVKGTIPTYSQQQDLWGQVEGFLARQRIRPSGPCLTIYYDTEYKESDVEVETCELIDAALQGEGPVKVYELPAVPTMACLVHQGSFDTLNRAYGAMMQWIERNGYRIVGPNREVYIRSGEPVRQDDPSYVTELQFPVARA